jgi:glc operon protein GlcG
MRNKPCLTLADAQRMAAACREAAARHDQEATIAIVDDGGHLIYLERPDQHRPNGVEMATLKARTAALRARPSSTLEARVMERPGYLMVPNVLAVSGGVPVFYAGECVGGVGISGIDANDEIVAAAGAEALDI